MKILLIVTIFLTNIFATEYTYSNKNSTKIDMHGGKTDTIAPTSIKNLDVNSEFLLEIFLTNLGFITYAFVKALS